MKRWTHYEDGKAYLTIGNHTYSGAAVDQFAAYEDIGYDPEELEQLREHCMFRYEGKATVDETIRFTNYYRAERDGRLSIMSFKPGNDVFVIEREADAPVDVCGYVFVAECGEHAIVSATINGSSDINDIMEDQATTTSFDGHGFLAVFPKRDCFHTYDEAVEQVTKEGGYAED